MSRTYKDRQKRRRIVKNKQVQVMANCWGDDFVYKNKRNKKLMSKQIRRNQNRLDEKETNQYL